MGVQMKEYKVLLWITSGICMLPVLLSAVLYNKLPEQIAVHWNGAGDADGFLPKALAAFGLPVLFVAINFFSKRSLYYNPKCELARHSKGIMMISTWAPPILSIILVPVTLFIAMGEWNNRCKLSDWWTKHGRYCMRFLHGISSLRFANVLCLFSIQDKKIALKSSWPGESRNSSPDLYLIPLRHQINADKIHNNVLQSCLQL